MQITWYKMRGARSRVDVALPPIHADAKINRAIVSRTYIRTYVACTSYKSGVAQVRARSRFLDRSIDRSWRRSLYSARTIDRPAIHVRAWQPLKCIHIAHFISHFRSYIARARLLFRSPRGNVHTSARNIAKPRNALNQISIDEHTKAYLLRYRSIAPFYHWWLITDVARIYRSIEFRPALTSNRYVHTCSRQSAKRLCVARIIDSRDRTIVAHPPFVIDHRANVELKYRVTVLLDHRTRNLHPRCKTVVSSLDYDDFPRLLPCLCLASNIVEIYLKQSLV